MAKDIADQYKRNLGNAERGLKKAQKALAVVNNVAIKKKTPEAYIAATKVVKETQLTIEALATLQKRQDNSSTIAIKAIACSIALQDTIRALKKDS